LIGNRDEESHTRILRCRRRAGGTLRLPRGRTHTAVVRDNANFVAGFNDDHVTWKCNHLHLTADDRAGDTVNVTRPNYAYDVTRPNYAHDADHRSA